MMGSRKNFTVLFGMAIKDTFMKLSEESKQLKHHSDGKLSNFFKYLIKIKYIFLIGDLFHS